MTKLPCSGLNQGFVHAFKSFMRLCTMKRSDLSHALAHSSFCEEANSQHSHVSECEISQRASKILVLNMIQRCSPAHMCGNAARRELLLHHVSLNAQPAVLFTLTPNTSITVFTAVAYVNICTLLVLNIFHACLPDNRSCKYSRLPARHVVLTLWT